MADKKAKNSEEQSKKNTNPAQPIPINSGVTDKNKTHTPTHPRKEKKAIVINVIQPKSNQPKIANWIAGISINVKITRRGQNQTYQEFSENNNTTEK